MTEGAQQRVGFSAIAGREAKAENIMTIPNTVDGSLMSLHPEFIANQPTTARHWHQSAGHIRNEQ
jgi:hypothetical protein